MVRAYVHERKGLMVDLPDELLLSQFQVRLTSKPPVVSIYPTEKLRLGSVVVEQSFPFTEHVEMQYKARPARTVQVPSSVQSSTKTGIEKFLTQVFLNPEILIGFKDSYDPNFDAGDIEGDPDDWSVLNTYLYIILKDGKLASLYARERHGKDDDAKYNTVLRHFAGENYRGQILPENIGKLTAQEVVEDVLEKLVLAMEIKMGLKSPVPK